MSTDALEISRQVAGSVFLNPVTLEAQLLVARNRPSHCLDAISKKAVVFDPI
jgi:hypothetical protein